MRNMRKITNRHLMSLPFIICQLSFSLVFAPCAASAQSITFRIAGTPSCSSETKASIESKVSKLLTEINNKGKRNLPLSLMQIPMTERARQSLTNRWKNFHYVCEDEANVEKLLETVDGYEVRGIPVEVRPTGKGYDGDAFRELVICLTKDARQITDVHPALSSNSYSQVLTRGEDVVDTRRRTEILSFVESFRSYYDEKDLKAIDQIFSEDALIITGKVVMKKSNDGDRPTLKPEYEYKKQSKTQYLSNLEKVFRNNQYIKVDFNDIEIVRHPGTNKQNWYGVTLRQHWKSEGKWSSYQDDGYVFLLWEFKDNEPPLIHVRTWQEERLHGKNLKKEDLFNINDFFIE